VIRCFLPLAESFGYATDLRSASQGRATYSMEFHCYQEAAKEVTQGMMAGTRG
jgi:elongation factor G